MRDLYGRKRAAQNGNPIDAPQVYETETNVNGTTTIVYKRFFDNGTEKCAIWKETTVTGTPSTFKREYAFAAWSDRASATYTPINTCWDID